VKLNVVVVDDSRILLHLTPADKRENESSPNESGRDGLD